MAHIALYRKWRPTVFEDIVGQGHITKTLKKQIMTHRVGHAYLFCGTRGTGKTTCAKVFSRAVNCLHPKDGSPCNECEICKGIADGSILDVTELDAASNRRIDDIREIINDVAYTAAAASYSVYIIDEVHMLTTEAFNALLKTLEEPPEHVVFILATTDPQKVPQTILSRCQRFDFKRISINDIILRLKEVAYGDGFNITDDAYRLIARLGDGSMRDALSVLERVASACGDTITAEDINSVLGISTAESVFQMTDAIAESNSRKIVSVIDELMNEGKDLNAFIDTLLRHLRDLMMCTISEDSSSLLDYSDEDIVKLKAQSKKLSFERLTRAASILSQAKSDAKWVKSPRIIYELALIKLARPETDNSPEALMDRIMQLESTKQAQRDEELYTRINNIEEKIKNGFISAAEPVKEEEPKPKKTVNKRLYNPIPQSELNGDNPIVQLAKKWDSISTAIAKRAGYMTVALANRPITIDRDGIIMLFKRNEDFAISMLNNNKEKLERLFSRISGTDYALKYIFDDEVGDNIIDIWSLHPSRTEEDQPQNDMPKQSKEMNIPEEDKPKEAEEKSPFDYQADDVHPENKAFGYTDDDAPPENPDELPLYHEASEPQNSGIREYDDPLDELTANFGELVEITDGTEFVNYNQNDDSFEQEDLFNSGEDNDKEEFLEESEIQDKSD